jgi:PAS domain S-box-containing protein
MVKSSFPVEYTTTSHNRTETTGYIKDWPPMNILSTKDNTLRIQAHLAAIVDNSYDAVFSKTPEGIIESWNTSAEKMYGYMQEEIIGHPMSILMPVNCKQKELSVHRIPEFTQNFQTTHRIKNGDEITVSLTISPIKYANGTIAGTSIIARNITDYKLWENSILDLNERLQISNRELEYLGHTLSHDLRKPIQTIEVFSSLLIKDHAEKLNSDGKQLIKMVNESSLRIRDMISGLLNISRIARAEVCRETIDMSKLVLSIIQEYRKVDPARDAEVVIQDNISIEGDVMLMRIALDNLIGNAWKFTRYRSKACIEFGETEIKGSTVYFLRDNGAGFDMKNASKLFVIFQRNHSDAEFEGTGVGLTTVQRIIRRHGGKIWAESEPDRGTTFYFTLS